MVSTRLGSGGWRTSRSSAEALRYATVPGSVSILASRRRGTRGLLAGHRDRLDPVAHAERVLGLPLPERIDRPRGCPVGRGRSCTRWACRERCSPPGGGSRSSDPRCAGACGRRRRSRSRTCGNRRSAPRPGGANGLATSAAGPRAPRDTRCTACSRARPRADSPCSFRASRPWGAWQSLQRRIFSRKPALSTCAGYW